jgi:hypothetical protein
MAAWSGFEPAESGFAERARARVRNRAFYGPPRYRNEAEQLPRKGPHPEAGSEHGGDLRQPLTRIDLEPVGLLEPQHEAKLVQREQRQIGAGDEDRRADDPVAARERSDEPVRDRAA